MHFLFLHANFPAQFLHTASHLAADPANRVVFGTMRQEGELGGIRKVIYKPHRGVAPGTHPYVRGSESAVLQGQAVMRMLLDLKKQGFVPDVVCGHSGWGPALFVKDIFPRTPLICLFEWFYHAHGTDADFDPAAPLGMDDEARIRIKNAPLLLDLHHCDWGVSPTLWQHSQLPPEYRGKVSVIHDGIDTERVRPLPGAKLVLPEIGLDLSAADEIVTYVARGMEPYRGFPQFMEAISLVMARRPRCHAVIVGNDRVAYGKQLPDGKTFKQLMLEKLPLDLARVHFTGLLPHQRYVQVLQASSVHVYLTYPFVLSWSMLEAMAAGCVVVGSDTPPVAEVIQDGVNGLLADFFSPPRIADRVEAVLSRPQDFTALRARARETIEERYALKKMLPRHIRLLTSFA